MTTYGSTTTRGARVVDGDVAKGMKPWEQKKALETLRRRDGLKFQPPVRKPPAEPSAAAREKGSKVEKGVGVAPVLARRTPAAARGGRRIVTGDQVNVRRIIGKNDAVSKAGLGAFKVAGQALKEPKALLGGLKGGLAAGRTGATRLASPATAGGRVGQTIGHAVGANPMKAGLAAGAVGGAGVMGHRSRREAMYAPSYAAPAMSPFGKALNPEQLKRLANVKAKKEIGPEGVRYRRATYSRIGIANMQNRAFDNPKGSWDVSDGMPRAMRRRGKTYADAEREMNKRPVTGSDGGVFKRSYDPEGQRRYRQGAAMAGSGIASGYLLQRGARDVMRDTRKIKGAPVMDRRIVPPELSAMHPSGKPRTERSLATRVTEIRNAKQHNATADIARNMRELKGVVITRRSGAKLGGGLAALGTAGALFRNRNEERWD